MWLFVCCKVSYSQFPHFAGDISIESFLVIHVEYRTEYLGNSYLHHDEIGIWLVLKLRTCNYLLTCFFPKKYQWVLLHISVNCMEFVRRNQSLAVLPSFYFLTILFLTIYVFVFSVPNFLWLDEMLVTVNTV